MIITTVSNMRSSRLSSVYQLSTEHEGHTGAIPVSLVETIHGSRDIKSKKKPFGLLLQATRDRVVVAAMLVDGLLTRNTFHKPPILIGLGDVSKCIKKMK